MQMYVHVVTAGVTIVALFKTQKNPLYKTSCNFIEIVSEGDRLPPKTERRGTYYHGITKQIVACSAIGYMGCVHPLGHIALLAFAFGAQ